MGYHRETMQVPFATVETVAGRTAIVLCLLLSCRVYREVISCGP